MRLDFSGEHRSGEEECEGAMGSAMSADREIHWVSAAATHVGKVRELNEDGVLDRPETGVWTVADGMGGYDAGEYASALVVDVLGRLPADRSLDSLIEQARLALEGANQQLVQEGRRKRARIMGSTVVSLLSDGVEAMVIWAGDSRAYRLRNGRLAQLTRDHSRIQELIDTGAVSPADADSHPEANVITRAVGVTPRLELDAERLDVQDGDTFLLCSDGLYRYVSDPEIQQFLGLGDCMRACTGLVERALESAARDNITAIVVRAELDDTAVRTRINPTPANRAADEDDDPTVFDDGGRG